MYLPRRSTASTRRPAIIAAISAGSSGRVSRASSIRAAAMRRPSMRAARRPRSVSTSGSSGKGVEDDLARWRGLVAELVRGEHLGRCLRGGSLVPCVNLRQDVTRGNLVAALGAAQDPDRIVDRVLLRPPAGAQM